MIFPCLDCQILLTSREVYLSWHGNKNNTTFYTPKTFAIWILYSPGLWLVSCGVSVSLLTLPFYINFNFLCILLFFFLIIIILIMFSLFFTVKLLFKIISNLFLFLFYIFWCIINSFFYCFNSLINVFINDLKVKKKNKWKYFLIINVLNIITLIIKYFELFIKGC